MHRTARENAARFFRTYKFERAAVVDIGSQDVNGSLKDLCPYDYVGVDFVEGRNVDVILDDPYSLPFTNESKDIVISSSCFEHSEFFWILFLEIMRILKPGGLFYLNVPSNGNIHRYPVDCWRFYPDSAQALVNWGRANQLNPLVLEHYTSARRGSPWNDYVAVFLKDASYATQYPDRIVDSFKDFKNGSTGENPSAYTEDQSSVIWTLRRVYQLASEENLLRKSFTALRDIASGRRRHILPR